MVFESVSANLSNTWNAITTTQLGVWVLVVMVLLIFSALIIYLSIKGEMFGKSQKGKRTAYKDVLNVTKQGSVVVPASNMYPASPNYSYSFWMYLDGHAQTKDFHKLVFYRGERDNIAYANPIVMMDEITNKMYIVLKTRDSSLSNSTDVDYRGLKKILERNYFINTSLLSDEANINNHIVFEINNVPLGRWVHFALSVSDNIVTIYVDGEIYAVKTADDFTEIRARTEKTIKGEFKKFPLIIDPPSNGNLYIGKSDTIGQGNSINGYLSKFDVFDRAISLSDVQRVYYEGPVSLTWMQKMGLNYGLRSPIFKKLSA